MKSRLDWFDYVPDFLLRALNVYYIPYLSGDNEMEYLSGKTKLRMNNRATRDIFIFIY